MFTSCSVRLVAISSLLLSTAIAEPIYVDDRNPIASTGLLKGDAAPIDLSLWTRAGNERFQQDVNTLVPLAYSESGDKLLFSNLSFTYRDGGNESFSGGIGSRVYLPEMNAVFGFHLHGDVSNSLYDHQIAQLGVGFDLFTASGVDLHGNLYLPETDQHFSDRSTSFGTPFGKRNSILQTENIFGISERGRRGTDVKVAFDVPFLNEVIPTRGHIGAYHFNGRKEKDLSGVMAGFQIQPFEGAAVGAEYYGDDDFFGDHWVFVAGVSAPFYFEDVLNPGEWARGIGRAFQLRSGSGKRNAGSMRDFLAAGVDRRNWVLTEVSDPFLTESKLNTVLDDVIFVNNGARGLPRAKGKGKGTFENPVNTIQRGVNRSAAKFGNSGNIVVAGSGRAYREDIIDAGRSVRLWGGRVPALAGRTFRYGARPVIDGGIGVTDVSEFSINNFKVINGALSFVNPDTIFASNVEMVSVVGNVVRNSAQDGIDIEVNGRNRSTAVVRNNKVYDSADDAIDIDTDDFSRLTLIADNNRLFRTGSEGFDFGIEESSRITARVTNNRIRGADGGGIEFDLEDFSTSTVLLLGNRVAMIDNEGIEIDQEHESVARFRILNNRITGTTDDPLDIDLDDDSVGAYQVVGNTIFGLDLTDDIDIDSDDDSVLGLQFLNNRSSHDLDFDEFGSSVFSLETGLDSNTLSGGAVLDIDPSIFPLVPAGSTGFPSP